MDRWQRTAHPAIAFVCDHNQRAAFGNGEISPCDAHISLKKLLAQIGTSGCCNHLGIIRGRHSQLRNEQIADLFTDFVQYRKDEMAWMIFRYLDDKLAEISFNQFQASSFQALVKLRL